MRFISWCLCLFLAGCDCSGGGSPCDTASDCAAGLVCRDGVCMAPTDGGQDDAGRRRDAGPGCPSAVLCGTPPSCCATGDECVEGECLAACASSVRCGDDLATCCGEGQVCVSDACVSPGDPCTDSFECEIGSFCEPTLGRCLTQFDPITCESTPVFGDFEVTLEWSATSATDAPECIHPISTPVVIDLDADRIPEVVVSMACAADWGRAIIRAFHGDTGMPFWSADDPSLEVWGRSSIAAADLDGVPGAEIVGVHRAMGAAALEYRLMALRGDGTLLWRSTNTDGSPFFVGSVANNGAPAIGDLDGDGSPEIVFGAIVLDANGVLQWTRDGGAAEGSNNGYSGGVSAIADLDGDDMPEVIAGRRAYHHDGSPMWTSSELDGYPAIAQFDADPQPEVVLVATGTVMYLDGLTGIREWGPVPLPGTSVGNGGPPTIADFDGDGRPEIGVAGASSYTVYDPDETDNVLWSSTTEDRSSHSTGSSVFDFEGDGAAEVIYGDECYMRVYSGRDGAVLLRIPNSTATIHEYPLVADIDGDGNSEIAIVANDQSAGLRDQCTLADATWRPRRGLFVYGDVRDQWMRTRRVWNQHTYHVTNITSEGTVPTLEADNWSTPGLNNYRQNVQGEGVFNAPDLKVLALEVSLNGCPETAGLRARVSNEGSLGVPAGVRVAFYRGTTPDAAALIGVATTTVPLLPGASTVVAIDAMLIGDPPYAFLAVVDDDGSGTSLVTECDEDDNAGGIGDVTCDILF